MKILWIVNTIFPYPARKLGIEKNVFGGWLNGLADNLIKNDKIELAIATVYIGKEVKEYTDGNITYYLLPNKNSIKYDKNLENHWKNINNIFKPDLVHIHGTEYPHGLAFINACPNVKTVTSIQGLIHRISEVYCANISYDNIKKNVTFRDIVKHDNILQAQQKFIDRSIFEKETIKRSDAIIGRTTWDYANVKAINPNITYYKGNETLRQSFYEYKWSINNIEPHSIFISQIGYPIKGFHIFIETIAILKKKYKNVKVYIAGHNILEKNKLKKSGYANYLLKLIQRYNIAENIEFTGLLAEEQMVEILLKTNVFVLPSAIENSSNSLGEAMLLGMPCVATNTGGTMDILEHKKEGFLYPYIEPAMCAEYICRFFENPELCIEYGQEARKTAMDRHDPKKNVETIIKIYKDIKSKGEK